MKDIKITLAKIEFHLLFNGAAMFATKKMFGEKNMLDAIKSTDSECFQNLCKATALLAEQGELYRRYMGQDKQKIITAEELMVIMRPPDIVDTMQAIMEAVTIGYSRDIENDENEEIDLGLVEINKKKATAD